jgi:HNH endonuclease
MWAESMINESAAKRFWGKVARGASDECWNWLAGKSDRGYGMFSVGYKGFRASRIAYELTHGDIPQGLIVRHKCDNPSCCNPEHLELGTNKDNTQDMMKRERCYRGPRIAKLKGAQAPRAKLTDEDVSKMRDLYDARQFNQHELAEMFGLTQAAVFKIVNRMTYRSADQYSLDHKWRASRGEVVCKRCADTIPPRRRYFYTGLNSYCAWCAGEIWGVRKGKRT